MDALPDDFILGLIRRWTAGEAEAFAEIYRRYFRFVRDIVHIRLGDTLRLTFESQDIAQDVFLQLMRVPPPQGVRSEAELKTYLVTAVINRLIDIHRKGTRIKRGVDREVSDADRSKIIRLAPDPSPSPSEVNIGREKHERFLRATQQLAPQEREAVILKVYERVSAKEGARRLGLPTDGAFRALLARALAKLEKLMNDDEAAT